MAINIGALLEGLRSAWKKFNEGETITIYGPNYKGKQQPSAYAEAVQQAKQPSPSPKLVAVSQNKTNAIMNNTAGNVAGTTTSVGKARNPAFSKFSVTPQVQDAISQAANKYQVPPELLYDIALQESSFDPSKTNPDARDINPQGLFQFTDSTWNQILNQYNNKPGMTLSLPSTDRFDPYSNAAAAAYLIKNGQLGKWDASEGVWGEYWTPQELQNAGFYSQSKYHVPGMRASVRLSGGN